MKTVVSACKLQSNALSIKLSDQVEKLDELIANEGDGNEFFERTHITQGMRDLISEGIARLAGASSQAVFHLKQAMGGGKTHLLIGFGLLARHPILRHEYCKDVAHADKFESASVAAFNGRNNPDHFFWGEIADQLGKGERFRDICSPGPKAPEEKDWLKLFEDDAPVLILLDEMPPYFHYLDTFKVGNGTIADIATRAFANLLTAAGKKNNVCVVISDLTAAYRTGSSLINSALQDARAETGRQERSITPVDLAANEVYEILRKRLFSALPDDAEISDIASAYGLRLAEAEKAKTANRGAEAVSDEVAATYPFHPRLKNLVALFKENEQFKQTRGLLELVSLLLRSVWEGDHDDIFLIGPQHFDLSKPEVREKLAEISGMRDVIARDIWDAQRSAHAQIIDLEMGANTANQVGSLLLTASLSTAVNAVRGLTREEMVECLISPVREASECLKAFEELEKIAWYLHHTSEGRFYFDRQENLTKLLQSLAGDAPENRINSLICHRLSDMFRASRKTAYGEVLPLPLLTEVADRVRRGRVLIIVSPDSKIPPEDVKNFFDGLSRKNNLCVLTGDKTAMGSVDKAARQLYAAQKADDRIPLGHPQREELERKQADYEQAFNATVLGLFDKVLFPIKRTGKDPELVSKPLDMTRDATKPFNGEAQIELTLVSDPLKLYLDVEEKFDAIREKAEELLWPENQQDTRWADAEDRYAEQSGMPWLPPDGLDVLKNTAIRRGLWEDLENGYISKKPRQKATSAQVVPNRPPDDKGFVHLTVTPVDAGPAPKIRYAEDSSVSKKSPLLKANSLTTKALKVEFLVEDPSGQYVTGKPVVWKNSLVLRNELIDKAGKRKVKLYVAPRGEIYYTLDGSEPRNGTSYDGEPILIRDGDVVVSAFAKADDLEAREKFTFPGKGSTGLHIDESKPARLNSKSGYKLDSRASTYDAFKFAEERAVLFENVMLTVGQGEEVASIMINSVQLDASFLRPLLEDVLDKFTPQAPVTMNFRKAHFQWGQDLKEFVEKLGFNIEAESVQQ